ncbi:MAG: O-antigen ligase family protein [Steroidobacteraceae bacterium]|jgi:O-antigen ligase
MFLSIKELIVVLALAATVFHLARPIALRFTSSEDFSRRRLVWFVLTAVSFVSPTFWLYTIVAVPMLVWANRNDSNPIALYLLMFHVVPPVGVIIPFLGNNGLFSMDNYRLLAFCVLLPAAMRYRKSQKKATAARLGMMDVLLLAFGVLQVVLYTPPDLSHHLVIPDSPSNALRRAILFVLDTYLLYFTVSRTCQSRRKIVDAAATFCLACAVLAAIAIFERTKDWLLYVDIASRWTSDSRFWFYLTRGNSVRAQVSAGHALSLGYLLAVAFGFWLYLKSHVQNVIQRIGGTLLLWGGLFAAFSRGPWLGALAVYLTFLASSPRPVSRLVKGTGLALALAGLIAVSPMGDRILEVLPVMGRSVDANVTYRQRLAERGWALVRAHPLFGDQLPWPEMEDLRQGEGIIDIVNTYVGVALGYGLIGLFCFLSFILLATARVYARTRELAQSDPDLALFGASLIACIVGTLIMIDTSSFVLGSEKMFYVLAGLATAYASLTGSLQRQLAPVGAHNKLRD